MTWVEMDCCPGTLRESLDLYIIAQHGGKHLYQMPATVVIELIVKSVITRWEHNRPEDEARVKEIRASAQQKGYIEGIISLAHLDGTLQCYDDDYRRMAITPVMALMLVSVLWGATQKDVAEEFNAINQSVSVPLVYMEGKVDVVTEVAVIEFVSGLCKLYPSHCSQSKACHTPNFNRDQR